MTTAIIPIGKLIDRTREKYPYRNLKKSEIDLLIALYDKYNGNVKAMSRDDDCQFKSTGQLFYYKKLYDFQSNLDRFRAIKVAIYQRNAIQRLSEAKIKVLERVFELLYPKTVKIAVGEDIIDIEKEPNYKEIEMAYKIIKTELGEPTTITKNENLNQDVTEIEQYREELKKLGEYVKTKIISNKSSA